MTIPYKTILLTGATGLIGRYLMKDLLLQGHRLIVLSRRKGLYSAKDRIEAIIRDWEERLHRRLVRPHVVEGDVREPFLGLAVRDSSRRKISPSSIPRSLTSIDAVLHSAASLRFEVDQTGEEPVKTNVEGVRNALAFAEAVGVSQFHHISTAYVCGKNDSTEVFPQSLDVGQTFQNIYEESKLKAELLVQHAFKIPSRTIYRPSIVVGDTTTGFSSNFTTIYSLPRFLRAVPEDNAHDVQWILDRLQMTGNEGKNLVPVDWVSQRVIDILNAPELHNQTYHLTNPNKTTGTVVHEALAEAIEISREAWDSMGRKGDAASATGSLSDEAFDTYLESYRGYLSDDPCFVPSRPGEAGFWKDSPAVDLQLMVKLFTFAINNRFRDPTPFPIPSNVGLASAMEYPLPIETWIEEFLEDAIETTSDETSHESKPHLSLIEPIESVFQLRLSGLGGGNWTIPSSSKPSASLKVSSMASAFIHLSVDSWCDLLNSTTSVSDLLGHGKLVFVSESIRRVRILAMLDTLIEDSKAKLALHLSSDEPNVLPIDRHKKGGRRFA